MIFVICAPSGTGKTSLSQKLAIEHGKVAFSISHTTRKKRDYEINGRDYYFINRRAFQEMIDNGDFVEYAEVYGELYGTSRQSVQSQASQRIHTLLDIEGKGAMLIKSQPDIEAKFICLLPPSLEELKNRLLLRQEENIEQRFAHAKKEILQNTFADVYIVNNDFDEAYSRLKNYILHDEIDMQHQQFALELRQQLVTNNV